MKIKNILMTALVLGGMASMSSCSGSFLDEDRNPNSLSPSVFWKNETDIMKGLTSAYAALQPNIDWAIPFERYIVIDNFRSDECDFRADVSSWMSIAMFTNESTSSVSKTECIIGKTNRDEIQNQMRLKFARKLQKRNVTEKSHTSYSQKWLSNVN